MPSSRIVKGRAAAIAAYRWNAPGPEAGTSPAPARNGADAHHLAPQDRYQAGYRDGEAAARAAQETIVAAAVEQLAETAANLAGMRASILRSSQDDLVRLSIAVARRILHRELVTSPEALAGIVSVVLERLSDQEIHRLRVHPSMVRIVEEQIEKRSGKIQVLADASLGIGGCTFETARGNVEAGIDSQLSEIERGLADRLEARR